MEWRKLWKDWLGESDLSVRLFSETDEQNLAPVLLRCSAAARAPLLVICPNMDQAEYIYADLLRWNEQLDMRRSLLFLPEAAENGRFIPENEADRVKALYQIVDGDAPDIIIASITAVLAPLPPRDKFARSEMLLRVGAQVDYNELLAWLVEMDYDDEFEVFTQGEFSRRGGIIDVFSPACEFPVRIEFWGNDIESMREFTPDTQRSVREVQEYRLIPRSSSLNETENDSDFFDYATWIHPFLALVHPAMCADHLQRFDINDRAPRWEDILTQYSASGKMFSLLDTTEGGTTPGAVPAGCFPAVAHLRQVMPDEIAGDGIEILRQLMIEQINQWLDTGYQVTLLARDEASREHIDSWRHENALKNAALHTDVADLVHGLILPAEKQVFLTEKEVFAARPAKRTSAMPLPRVKRNFIDSADEEVFKADVDEGDMVVHIVHGIGIFRGIREVERRGTLREVMVLEYRDGAMVYVPVCQASLISKYIGAGSGSVKLHKLGCKSWLKSKIDAEKAVRDFALDMLKVQALRSSAEGIAFPADDLQQRIFEDAFPYEDTPDQVRTSIDIKNDMCAPRPMDRLLCGDVGYGKTEVAIRAAFKAVMAGKQVALLVPTTILAQQHYYSFCERFAGYPVIIDMLSRFRSRAEQNEIIQRLREGTVDIVIGTHRLVQDDIEFARLGLAIIDEEQRFGVGHKEKLKNYRATVDVLTMTATPIPRTLYMSMSGVRDLSTIVTAPSQRLPVHTVVARQDDAVVQSAIRQEVQRGGQVFYLHNRVKTIDRLAEKFRQAMPDIRFGVGHGQMNEDELELVMAGFLAGRIDVLICTTIIESGLDIPNANTIIIERADRFGLAELYQLRGRVGRWTRQAYAYLLLPESNIISSDARKRLSAIRRFTHLGAGFKLALRDLEIRGAGNLLGAEQSGHINSIGFDLYCQLLKSTVGQLKGESQEVLPEVDMTIDFLDFAHQAAEGNVAAGFPPDYISCERLRIEAYRRLSNMSALEQVDALAEECEDRYGKLPESAVNMFDVTRIRIMAAHCGFHAVKVVDGKIFLECGREVYRLNGKIPFINAKQNAKYKLHDLKQIVELVYNQHK
ncbi:MAG: transcription-repair coupling factor [Victivallales bacterium]|nr:transcription-repair coupling factor [Victivallales bacterium]